MVFGLWEETGVPREKPMQTQEGHTNSAESMGRFGPETSLLCSDNATPPPPDSIHKCSINLFTQNTSAFQWHFFVLK